MKRTVTIEAIENSHEAVRVIFREGKRIIAKLKYFNYIGYGDALARATCEFVMMGIIPKDGHGLLDID